MGVCFSSKPSFPSFDTIRLVHLNGFVEDFQASITVKKVQMNHPKHYVCTMAQLLPNSSKLPPETQLQPGKLYFLLPFSLFQSETSPANMVAIGIRLTALATSSKAPSKVPMKGDKVGKKAYREQKPPENGSWKPGLSMIIEKSMEQSSKSD